jgi:hypothetical protein
MCWLSVWSNEEKVKDCNRFGFSGMTEFPGRFWLDKWVCA